MRGKPTLFWAVNLLLFVSNLTVLAVSLSREVQAGPEGVQQTQRGRFDQVDGTIRLEVPSPVRNYELLNIDSANQAQLQTELVSRLSGRVDARIETSWQDPYRTVNGNFRTFFVISWVR